MTKRLLLSFGLILSCVSLSAGEKPDTSPITQPPVIPAPTPQPHPGPPIPAVLKEQKPMIGPDGRDWPGIFRNLQSADLVVRDAAITDLMQALDPIAQKSKKPYYAKLKDDVTSKDVKVHDEAANRVKLIGQVIMVNPRFKAVIAGLMSADAAARNEQVEYVFKSTEESLQSDHVRDLIEQLGADDPAVMAKAVEELKGVGGEAADDLASALDEEKVQIKKAAADLLRGMGPGAKDAVNSLVFKIKDGDDKLGRKYAAQVLEGLGADAAEAVDDLVLSLDDEDKVLRRICANILKKMGTAYKDAAPDIVSYLTGEDKGARNLAVELLLALGAEAQTGAQDLIDIIDEPQPVTPANAAPPQNTESANDMDAKVRAAKVLASIGPAAKATLPGLKKFANDNDPGLKAAVQEAIDKITEGKPIDEVIKTLPVDKPPAPPVDKPADKSRPGENF